MKKMLVCALGLALIAMCGPASAAKVWDDMSWWGNTGATPAPVKDATRSGYWWWPTEPASNAGDAELWGNRGIVYAQYQEPTPPAAKVIEPPKPTQPPAPKRETPVFNNVLFDFDKSNIRPDAEPVLTSVVDSMNKFPKDTMVIEGHTCNVGEEAYNMGLGQRRADSVKKWLVEHGVADGRVTTTSLGETQPAVANDTPANRKLNRRVVFKVTMGN